MFYNIWEKTVLILIVYLQLISLNTGAGVVDDGDMTPEAATELFGTTKGFKVAEPNPGAESTTEEDEDF